MGDPRTASSESVLALRGNPNPVMSVSLSGDATRLVTVGQISQEARVWDVSPAGRGEVLTLPGPEESGGFNGGIAFTPDGGRLVAPSGPEGTVRVWNAKTGAELLVLDGHARADARTRDVIGVDVSPDGSRIATAGADGSARVYDAVSGEELLAVRGRHCAPRARLRRQPGCLQPGRHEDRDHRSRRDRTDHGGRHGRELSGARAATTRSARHVSPSSGARTGSACSRPARVGARVWDVGERAPCSRALGPTPGPGIAAAWSPDGTQIVTEGAGPVVWDATTGT